MELAENFYLSKTKRKSRKYSIIKEETVMKIKQRKNVELQIFRQHKKHLCRWLESKRDTNVEPKEKNIKV